MIRAKAAFGRLSLLVLVLFVVSCAGPGTSSPQATTGSTASPITELGSVVVGVGADPSGGRFIAAVQKGYLKSRGVNATLRVFASFGEAQQAMLAGDVDITHASETFPLLAKSQGGNFSLVNEMGQNARSQALVVTKDINKPEDLIGKKLGYVAGLGSEYHMLRYLALHKIDRSRLSLVNVAVNNMVPVFAKGEIDAFILWSPHIEKSLEAVPGAKIIHWNGENALYVLRLWDLFGAKLSSSPPLAAAVMKALLDAEKFVNENPEEAAAMIAAATNVDVAVVKGQLPNWKYRAQVGPESLQALKDVNAWLKDAGRVKTDPDWATLFNLQPLRDAAPDRITLK